MPTFKDISGQRFGLLVAVEPITVRTTTRTRTKWKCDCDCGKTVVVTGSNLISGHTKSCGCLNSQMTTDRNRIIMVSHGGHLERLYGVWHSMKARCNNPHNKAYSRYGGRGIKLCAEWERSYSAFREWALASGYDKNADFGQCTIDRIDNDLGYFPDNCRWITKAEQQRNKSNSKARKEK